MHSQEAGPTTWPKAFAATQNERLFCLSVDCGNMAHHGHSFPFNALVDRQNVHPEEGVTDIFVQFTFDPGSLVSRTEDWILEIR